jgi:hypothetical protein
MEWQDINCLNEMILSSKNKDAIISCFTGGRADDRVSSYTDYLLMNHVLSTISTARNLNKDDREQVLQVIRESDIASDLCGRKDRMPKEWEGYFKKKVVRG